ncbi:MAG: carbohydrate ABC transporter permease [Chloroflexota bacterium]|nr:carbohydrate ABC transporter permease [Chloroflexota bacterium]
MTPPRRPLRTRPSTAGTRWSGNAINFLARLVVVAVGATVILGLTWIVVTSLKTNQELFADVWRLPASLHLENYANAWTIGGMGMAFANSVIATVGAAISVVAIAAPAAYVLSRAEFPGREMLINTIAAGMGIPAVLIFIPVYLLLSTVGFGDSLAGLGAVYVGVQMPFTVFILTGFFATLPVELEEAAIIDGASEVGVFWRIMLPLARPGLLTALIFNLIFLWKEFFWALVLLRSRTGFTLGVALNSLRESLAFNADWTGLFAAVVILMGPAVLAYLVLSRQFVRAITFGASR